MEKHPPCNRRKLPWRTLKMNKKRVLIVAILSISVVCALFVGFVAGRFSITLFDPWMAKIIQAKYTIQNNYYGDFNMQDVKEGALKGMTLSLDPYSMYYTPKEAKEFMSLVKGEYIGIGVVIEQDKKSGYCVVVGVFPGGSAFTEGVLVGDLIVEVEGISTKNKTPSQVASMIRGEESKSVRIIFLRDKKKIEKTLIRKKIKIESVKYKMIESQIGYFRIHTFDENVVDLFNKAFKKARKGNIKAILIDLRFNPGGGLDYVCLLADRFLGKCTIVKIKGKTEEIKEAQDDPDDINLPLVVLVSPNSASASEIFCAAIKDNRRGTIIGEKTYGKGSIQTPFRFADGSILRLTTGKFISPSGAIIDQKGIKPDIVVKMSEEDYEKLQKAWGKLTEIGFPADFSDKQLQKGLEILRSQLKQ
jgi:carboxyl-terminal processing protease